MVPLSGGWAPARILSSVDLPAPFSPRSAWISAAPTSKSTSCERAHAGKGLGDAPHAQKRRFRVQCCHDAISRGGARSAAGAGPAARNQCARYFTSPRRSPISRLSLVTATGVSSSDLLGGLGAVLEEVHQDLHAERALLAGELLDGGGHAAVADLGQRFRQRVEADDDDARRDRAPSRLLWRPAPCRHWRRR